MRFVDKYHENFGQDASEPYTGFMPDGSFSCPSKYGYEPDDYACDEMATCKKCWEREMPK